MLRPVVLWFKRRMAEPETPAANWSDPPYLIKLWSEDGEVTAVLEIDGHYEQSLNRIPDDQVNWYSQIVSEMIRTGKARMVRPFYGSGVGYCVGFVEAGDLRVAWATLWTGEKVGFATDKS